MSASDLLWTWKTVLYRLFRERVPPFSTIYRAEKRGLQRWLGTLRDRNGLWLDLGCGEGTSFSLTEWNGNRVGVDRVRRLLARGRGLEKAHRICASAENLPFRSGAAALVTAVGLVEYVRDRRSLWEQVQRVLRPGGVAVVTAARPNALNRLRRLLGHRLTLVPAETLASELHEAGFVIEAQQATLLQWQVLLLKPKRD